VITVYHLNSSRSERVVWLLEELGIPYRMETFRREPNGAAPAAMKAIHAIGRSPIIHDGDTVLAESGAIVEYLVQRHGDGRLAVPHDAPNYPRYLYWMHFAEGSLMPLMLNALVLSRVPEAKESPVNKRVRDRVQAVVGFIDAELRTRGPYFVGEEFTAADVMMQFPFGTMRRYLQYDLEGSANVRAWLDRIEERPAFRKAIALAGPDAKLG
jgi:glutathione S-transferase